MHYIGKLLGGLLMKKVYEREGFIVTEHYRKIGTEWKLYEKASVKKNDRAPRFRPLCNRISCAVCSVPGAPVFQGDHENKNHEFVPADDGCWQTFIGSKPKRVSEAECNCVYKEEE